MRQYQGTTTLYTLKFLYVGLTRPHTIEDQVQYFERNFCTIANQAYKEVEVKMKGPDFLACVTCLSTSARNEHRSFIMENLINIQTPVTIEKIWINLNLYWDFMNYGLLEHVISMFGSEDLKHQMQQYVYQLSMFKRVTRLCDFIKCWPCKDDRPPKDCLKKVVVKIQNKWFQCTLEDMESFMKALIRKFFLPEADILLQKVERGCVCVTWLTSPSIAELLQRNSAIIVTELFTKFNIDFVTVEGKSNS